MTILESTRNDLLSILELQKVCYWQEAEIYDDFVIPPLTQTLASITHDFEQQVILKAESEKTIVGSVRGYLEGETCKIGRLIVHQDFQNKGIGAQLMRAIEERFAEAQMYELFTGHLSAKNLYLYKKLGYTAFRQERVNNRLELVFLEKKNDQ
uniref:GNAT family N-acetyltransferase n=1 Tax=Roseihalotalea indica TaxID=2867963 RepID=A0AA49GHQ9_9BACT|nr:GNAT family N-acetyltransferase [Tunicatimonas sp. TK19036]